MSAGSVQFEVQMPVRWQRAQVLLRLAIVALLAQLHTGLGWILLAFYWLLPIVAAVSIQRGGAGGYVSGNGKMVLKVLRAWSAFLAYMLFVSDRLPASASDLDDVRFEVSAGDEATFNRALVRWLSSLPEFLVIVVLGWVSVLLAVVAAASVLAIERVPAVVLRVLAFQVSLQARWLAYHASLVEVHPLIVERNLQPH